MERLSSSVTLSDSLDLILLLDSIRVTSDTLGSGNDLISEAFTHALVGSEAGLSGALAHEIYSLIDSSEWGDINSLSSNSTA